MKILSILVLFLCSAVYAADYRVLVIPDNVASKPYVDSMIYEGSSEFFANQILSRLT